MSNRTARISLRYRPGADVLSGQIDLGNLGELGTGRTVTESPDADSTMAWASTPDDPDGALAYLASFHFVHVSARLQQGALPLPDELAPTVRTLINTAPRVDRRGRKSPGQGEGTGRYIHRTGPRLTPTRPMARASTWRTSARPPAGRRCIHLVVPPCRCRQPTNTR